jgi:hypothetical protein
MAYVCLAITHYKEFEYRLVQIIQKTPLSKVLSNPFGVVRTQLGSWFDRGKEVAWHWGIQVRRKGEKGRYCSVGLKKAADDPSRAELTSPDVYDGPKCWRASKDMGCAIRTDFMDWAPLGLTQRYILNLVLRRPARQSRKTYALPLKFSYLAHFWASPLFNCNKFANNFHAAPAELYGVLRKK